MKVPAPNGLALSLSSNVSVEDCGVDNFQYTQNRRSPITVTRVACFFFYSLLYQLSIKHQTSTRHA